MVCAYVCIVPELRYSTFVVIACFLLLPENNWKSGFLKLLGIHSTLYFVCLEIYDYFLTMSEELSYLAVNRFTRYHISIPLKNSPIHI